MHAGQICPMRLPSAELEPLVEMIESQISASLKKKERNQQNLLGTKSNPKGYPVGQY